MIRAPVRWLPLACAAVLAACASTPTVNESGRVANPKEAAGANVKLGVAYMQRGELALAKEKLERAAQQDPRNHEVHWAMASLYERMNQPQNADRSFQAALRLAPGNPEIANTYAVFMCRNGELDRSLSLFDQVIANPLYRTPWAAATNAAVCLRSDKRNAEAVPYLQQALNKLPVFVDAVVQLADTQLALSKPAEARSTVDNFLSMGRKSADVLLLGVRSALAQGDRQAADAYARQLRRDFPNTPQTSALPQLMSGTQPTAAP